MNHRNTLQWSPNEYLLTDAPQPSSALKPSLKRPRSAKKGGAAQPIFGKTQDENVQAAKRLKMILEGDSSDDQEAITEHIDIVQAQPHVSGINERNEASEAERGKDGSGPGSSLGAGHVITTPPSTQEPVTTAQGFGGPYGKPTHYTTRLLRGAYEDAFKRYNEKQEMTGGTEDSHAKAGKEGTASPPDIDSMDHPHHIPPMTFQPVCQGLLPGLGKGRQRSRYGKSLEQGQETGQGVIGQPVTHFQSSKPQQRPKAEQEQGPGASRQSPPPSQNAQPPTVMVTTSVGCDIPYDFADYYGVTAQTHTKMADLPVSLDVGLPPLAIQHPARVWNAIIHSLNPENQPIIVWTFKEITVVGDTHYIAHLFVAAGEDLGQCRECEGQSRPLKLDAMNSCLVTFMPGKGRDWLKDLGSVLKPV